MPAQAHTIHPEKNSNLRSTDDSIKTYVYVFVVASMCIIIGFIWDYGWHMSIGRDGIFTPPHDFIYLGAIVAGTFSGYQVIKKSFFGTAGDKAGSVKFWGIFYSSLGGLFCIWGAFAMLTSAPFDNWWHNTYGLDTKVLSPPHVLLLTGMMTIQLGAYISVVAAGAGKTFAKKTAARHNWLFAISAGSFLATLYTLFSEPLDSKYMHGANFYIICSLLFPVYLFAISRASKIKWGATAAVGVYTAEVLIMLWLLPLFPAKPLLGPVFYHIDHFQPFKFPLLLIVPAITIDILFDKLKNNAAWVKILLASLAFILLFFVVQWYFGGFYHTSQLAKSWFFASYSLSFQQDPGSKYRYAFNPGLTDAGRHLVRGLSIAAFCAIISGCTGYAWGGWMKRIQR